MPYVPFCEDSILTMMDKTPYTTPSGLALIWHHFSTHSRPPYCDAAGPVFGFRCSTAPTTSSRPRSHIPLRLLSPLEGRVVWAKQLAYLLFSSTRFRQPILYPSTARGENLELFPGPADSTSRCFPISSTTKTLATADDTTANPISDRRRSLFSSLRSFILRMRVKKRCISA